MIIRPYQPTDWTRICAIHDAARLDELRHSVGEAAFRSLEETFEREELFAAWVKVAELHGRIEGFVAYSEIELTWLYVDPAMYRKGVGRALLRHAVKHARTRLTVEVLEGNKPALQLYLSEGFKFMHRAVGRLEGNEEFAASGFVLERAGDT